MKALHPINPIVGFYNSISIKHGVTAGAFDLDDLKSKGDLPLELRKSAESDTFLALVTPDSEEPIEVPKRRAVIRARKHGPHAASGVAAGRARACDGTDKR